ncbi:MAG: hypothetical protein ABI210_06585, partial [Abditibacteriaceae bacterium]
RRQENGALALMVINASLDAQDLKIRILNAPPEMRCMRSDGSEETLTQHDGDAYGTFTITNLGAWQSAVLS